MTVAIRKCPSFRFPLVIPDSSDGFFKQDDAIKGRL